MDNNQIIYCPNCGHQNSSDAKFCKNCGNALPSNNETVNIDVKGILNSIFDSTTSELNRWTGGKGAVKVSLRDFFSQVFKKHTREDAENIFIAGTKTTTPSLTELSVSEVHPWLFSRIFFFTVVAGILLSILSKINGGVDVLSAAVVMAVSVPFSALILFFEINVFKNISFYRIMQMVLIGGVLSLIVTILFDNTIAAVLHFPSGSLPDSLSTGIIEEFSKVLIAAYFINKLNTKSIFNGLLIGAAIGTGFAAIENIQYLVEYGVSIIYAIERTLTSISTHTEWCAISSAALVLAKGSHKLELNDFLKTKFLRFFILAILLHTCWDWSIPILRNFDVPYTLLDGSNLLIILITWLTILILIHAGLREVKLLQLGIKNNIKKISN